MQRLMQVERKSGLEFESVPQAFGVPAVLMHFAPGLNVAWPRPNQLSLSGLCWMAGLQWIGLLLVRALEN